MAKNKALLMREHRARMAEQGLVPVTCWVKPEHKGRLSKYVQRYLFGECNVRLSSLNKKRKGSKEEQTTMAL